MFCQTVSILATAQVRAGFEEGVYYAEGDQYRARQCWHSSTAVITFQADMPVLIEGLYLAHKSAGDEIYTALHEP